MSTGSGSKRKTKQEEPGRRQYKTRPGEPCTIDLIKNYQVWGWGHAGTDKTQ
jgi:hypothetical protein